MKRKLFYGAWLLTAVAALMGCSSENELAAPTLTKTTWKVVAEAEKPTADDDSTRALSIGGNTGKTLYTLWDTTDKIYVIKADGTVPNGYLYPAETSSLKSKLKTDNLEGTYAVGDVLTLRSTSPTVSYANQKGTLGNVSANYAFMEAEVEVTSVDEENKILTFSTAKFAHRQAFLKLAFTDGTNALDVSQLKISDQKNFTLLQSIASDGAMQYEDLTITPDDASSELFIALHNDHDGAVEYTLTATVNGETYKGTKTVPAAVKDGKYGVTTVTLTKEAYHAQGNPLTFESVDGSELTLTYVVGSSLSGAKPIEYSTDGGSTWTPIAGEVGQTYTMNGATIQVRGNNSTYGEGETGVIDLNKVCNITGDKDHYVYGNIMSLINATNYETLTELTGTCTFYYLFAGNTHLKSHSTKELELPATTLTTRCYAQMFKNCIGLTRAPELPAKVMTDYCYWQMFMNCSSLASAPVMHSSTLATACYSAMFYDCTSLTSAPALPATTLVTGCYAGLFLGCSSLTTAPALPAMTLEDFCYQDMFRECTSLTTAPVLPATALKKSCYMRMFHSCTSLNYVKCLATDISANGCTSDWFFVVPATGTFVKKTGMEGWPTGINGIPSGWTVEEADE